VSPLPGVPSNPKLLVIDASVALPLLLTNQIPLLRHIKASYSIQPVVVEAVDAEIMGLMKGPFAGLDQRYRKAVRLELLSLADEEHVKGWYGDQGKALYRQMNIEGLRLYETIDRGEAYSHAAANSLGAPIATNDMQAVRILRANGEQIAVEPPLGFWDLVTFGFQTGLLTTNDCDAVRQHLGKAGQALPAVFKNSSFEAGLPDFFCHLTDRGCRIVGQSPPGRQNRLWVTKTSQAAGTQG